MRPRPTTRSVPLPTRQGTFLAGFDPDGLVSLSFPQPPDPASRPTGPTQASDPARSAVPKEWIRQTTRAVVACLEGKPTGPLPPLSPHRGTDFQRAVWEALARIPRGQTRTYGEIARTIGRPRAVRAVGQACGANPLPLIIPCHRVLAAGNRLGGFSAGLDWKTRLLRREGVSVADAAHPDIPARHRLFKRSINSRRRP